MSNLTLKKSTFIHIPKCAGTLLQAFLYKMQLVEKHHQYPNYGHLFLHQMPFDDANYRFCFVRNPYTWWPSFHEWCKKDRFSQQEKECPTFDLWIEEFGPFWMGQYTRLIQRYTGEDTLYPSARKIDFVGKVENLFPDLQTALQNASEDFSEDKFKKISENAFSDPDLFPWKNEQQYDKNISDKSKEIIYNSEKYVFDRFNYQK